MLPRRNSSPPRRVAPDMMRGRSASSALGDNVVRSSTPPSYARHSLDRSPLADPRVLDERPRVPPPIYLRSSSPQPQSSKGSLKIHVPGWGVALVRPPRKLDIHPLETGASEPPTDDTVLTGALEVIMKERRRVQAISVGVQGVCRLHMGVQRGWEEDGIFERGVEVMGGDAEGIWLERGSQSILLPATLAVHDYHQFARLSYIITARVEGIADSGGLSSLWKSKEIPAAPDIPWKADFDAVIARSDKLAQDLALHRTSSAASHASPAAAAAHLSPPTPQMAALALSASPSPVHEPDDSAIAFGGEGSPTLNGLFHRRQSSDLQAIPHLSLAGSPLSHEVDADRQSVRSVRSAVAASIRSAGGSDAGRSEKMGWLKGDISAMRGLVVHATPSSTGGVYDLDLRKEGYVAGLGSWRFHAAAEAFAISSVMLVSINIPAPAPACTIFFVRLLLAQRYVLHSPRTPNKEAHKPEKEKTHVLYQVGRPHKFGEKVLGHDVTALWRGPHAGGKELEPGWKTRAVVRVPNHDKVRPTTHEGTITPIRVTHDFMLQIFYSVDKETVAGAPLRGPGEVRMCQIKMGVLVPSCCCTTSSLDLPTYETAGATPRPQDHMFDRPNFTDCCQCGTSFAQLGEAAMRRMQCPEPDDVGVAGNGADESGPAASRPLYRRAASDRGKEREARGA